MDRAADHGDRARELETAASLLRAGRLVAFPTETVYGLGAIATDDLAVARIFEAKERPHLNPLIVHVADRRAAEVVAIWTDLADRLADQFWPGALTLVLSRKATCPISRLVSAGGDTVALRAPSHPLARALLRATGLPVAAPSANRAGRISPTTAAHVIRDLGDRVDLVIDGGACAIGVESTVVDLSTGKPRLLRPGGVPRDTLESVIGQHLAAGGAGDEDGAPLRSPGQLSSHYAPRHRLRLDALDVRRDEALLAFGPLPLAGAAHTSNLSPTTDLREAAANLFSMLHHLDRQEVSGIAVMPIPATGLGEAIGDRLLRAAADPCGPEGSTIR